MNAHACPGGRDYWQRAEISRFDGDSVFFVSVIFTGSRNAWAEPGQLPVKKLNLDASPPHFTALLLGSYPNSGTLSISRIHDRHAHARANFSPLWKSSRPCGRVLRLRW